MDLTKLSNEELRRLKKTVENQIIYNENLKLIVKESENKEILSDLNHNGDSILCISFHSGVVSYVDYVKFYYYPQNAEYVKFSTSHETLPIGCSSSFHIDSLNNHCFLSEFSSYHFYFFTLKPDLWREDIRKEIEKLNEIKTTRFTNELNASNSYIENLVLNDKLVDEYIDHCKEMGVLLEKLKNNGIGLK